MDDSPIPRHPARGDRHANAFEELRAAIRDWIAQERDFDEWERELADGR